MPGAVLIILSGKFRGRRVVFLKQLDSGLLLVSGPFGLNGVPLKRMDPAYVIGTSTKVDVSGVTVPESVNDSFFKKASSGASGEFFDKEKDVSDLIEARCNYIHLSHLNTRTVRWTVMRLLRLMT